MNRNLCKTVIENGGQVIPLIIPCENTKGLGLMNPSILIDNEKIIVNLRSINYTLYHCEGDQRFNNRWGPLVYLNPENDVKLKTENYICLLDENLTVDKHYKVDMSSLNITPVWEFHGLEDARLIKWDDKLYLCGVRRDVKPNGEGRMELSEIVFENNTVKEISRFRIPDPNPLDDAYCNKNWVPILDIPYHFIKWMNPLEIVIVDPISKTCKTVKIDNTGIKHNHDFRGGSQIINWDNFRLGLVHITNVFKNVLGQKDATYTHKFILWDKNWNIVHISEEFSFMTAMIEFACGMAFYKGDLLITFGFQDNAAYLIKIPKESIELIIGYNKVELDYWDNIVDPIIEITTSIPKNGCVVNCVFCPQEKLINKYNDVNFLSLDNFKSIVDKLPRKLGIIFAGFSEPFLNKECADMILYAYSKGFKVTLFTTGIGMSIEDFNRIKDIPFSSGPDRGFCLHIPDNENNSKHKITNQYIDLLKHIKEYSNKINNFRVIAMGSVHDKVKDIFPIINPAQMYSRAGNLNIDNKKHSYITTDNGEGKFVCNKKEGNHHINVLPNGDTNMCCQDYNLDYVIGNIHKQDYKEIVTKIRNEHDLCRYCENGIRINEKLKTLPHIYYTSYITCKERSDKLELSFKKYGITNYTRCITNKSDDKDFIVTGSYIDKLANHTLCNTISHFRMIKKWYYESDSEYALFMEDDISIDTIDNWSFTWDDFMNNLPNEWDCIQLVSIVKGLNDVKLKSRKGNNFWSVTGYLLNRKYAKYLISQYCRFNGYHLDIQGYNIIPDCESLIYIPGNTYTIPLFYENIEFKSSFNREDTDKEGYKNHKDSSIFVNKWWKKNGLKSSINDLMKLS